MVPDGLQAPPLPSGASASATGAPPSIATFISLPRAKKPIDRPSGDQKGCLAPSDPTMTVASLAARARTYSSRVRRLKTHKHDPAAVWRDDRRRHQRHAGWQRPGEPGERRGRRFDRRLPIAPPAPPSQTEDCGNGRRSGTKPTIGTRSDAGERTGAARGATRADTAGSPGTAAACSSAQTRSDAD